MASLSVNLDQVAALREVRKLKEPDPAHAAVLAELAGADGIAVQLRRDRKYVRDRDLYILREVVKTRLTIEMPPTEETINLALEVKPWMVTFVADQPDSDAPVAGIDFSNTPVDFGEIVVRMNGVGINVCFLVEPETDAVKGAAKAGAGAVLLNCAAFTGAKTLDQAQEGLDLVDSAAQAASKANLTVNAGRGISYRNVQPLVELGLIDEFVVGHAIACHAVLVGFGEAVREFRRLLQSDQRQS
jgi:pyridoxine 5-phosphate synthase